MNAPDFLNEHCVEYPKGSPTLDETTARTYLVQTPGWQLSDDAKSLQREWRMDDFVAAVRFLNRVMEVAEAEQHHPDVRIHSYRMIELTFSTHSAGGLTNNDFIMAARVNALATS